MQNSREPLSSFPTCVACVNKTVILCLNLGTTGSQTTLVTLTGFVLCGPRNRRHKMFCVLENGTRPARCSGPHSLADARNFSWLPTTMITTS